MARFLRYVVEKTLADDVVALRERQIGIEVFERAPDWDPKLDNIVRTEARRLRAKLETYAALNDPHERVRITMPTGGYGVQFEERLQDDPLADAAPTVATETILPVYEQHARIDHSGELSRAPAADHAHEEARLRTHGKLDALRAANGTRPLFLLLALVVSVLAIRFGIKRRAEAPRGLDALWSVLFQNSGRTLIVTSDAGLNLYYDLSSKQRLVSPQEYASRSYLFSPVGHVGPPDAPPFADRRYTTMSDVKLLADVLHLPGKYSQQADVRFARAVSAEDLKRGSAILIGAPNYNPWVQLFDKNIDFQIAYGGDIEILNKNPQPGEPKTYARVGSALSPESPTILVGHAVISLVSSPGYAGRILLVEGKSMDNLEAAIDFLFDEQAMRPVLLEAEKQDGRLRNFDLVLETRYMQGGSLDAKSVALHVHPALR